MVVASKIKNSLYAWIFAFIVSITLAENSVGKNFSYQWNESGKIESSTLEDTRENGFNYEYDASGYTIGTNKIAGGFDPKFWKTSTNFQGNKVFQRDDLIDITLVDKKSGLTNLQLMQKGRAPIGPDGRPINLHHMTQNHHGSIAEVTQTFHQQNSKIIHINPSSTPSGINRSQFNKWRANYWKNRATGFE